MNRSALVKQYDLSITALNRTGIITRLPRSKKLGVVGVDGKAYPLPTLEQLQDILTLNKELVDRKLQQGFTQLQITPIAIPVLQLMERVKTALLDHAAAGKINQTKQKSTDTDIPVLVNKDEQIWMWARVRQILDTPQVVYFPQIFTREKHQGYTKKEAIRNPQLCAVPGWSVGLIETIPIMPQPGQGKVIAGRKQLEAFSTPRDYLQALQNPPYQGETGWTLEDFLTQFIVRLETSDQVSHDRIDNNALWLLGMYLPYLMPKAQGVPVGYWSRKVGRKLYLSAHRTGNRFRMCGARTMVRLSA